MDKRKKDVLDVEAKKAKSIHELRKGENIALSMLVKQRKDTEEERKRNRNMEARENATKILKNAKEEERARVERERKRKEDYDNKLNEDFERDK